MKDTEKTQSIFLEGTDFIYPGAPTTHIFYEYQGERAVDPHQLVMDGKILWSEQALNNLEHKREVLRLWNDAEALLAKRRETPTYSYVEWLRYLITMGVFDPKKSKKKKKPYAYRSMLISALYFQEAERLSAADNADRVWHLVVMAYYHLGMNTKPSSTQLTAKAAKKKHEKAVDMRRALALVPLEIIKEQQKKKKTIRNIEEAKDEVIRLIYSNKKVLADLEQIDELSPNRDKNSNALDRFRSLLDEWTCPNSPHPDIAEAFSVFGQKEYVPRTDSTGPKVPGSAIDPEVMHYMRQVHVLENGDIFTVEISRGEETPDRVTCIYKAHS